MLRSLVGSEMCIRDRINIEALIDEQHFTQPPPRYSEASLVKKLEELGIGRPSTYASIISTIANRGYAEIINKRFFNFFSIKLRNTCCNIAFVFILKINT